MKTRHAIYAALASTGILLAHSTGAFALTPAERCEGYQLAASGARISAKLHCHAWAKFTGGPVDSACLDRAEKKFLLHLQEGGDDCATPSDVVSIGAAADAQMSDVVAEVATDNSQLSDLTGTWMSRSSIVFNPEGGAMVDCEHYPPGKCPEPEVFLIIDCETQITQDGNNLTYASVCDTPPESPLFRPTFPQAANGPVDLATGEWMLSGTVDVPGLSTIEYDGEGVFSADGQSYTGFTTAGFEAGGNLTEWLATTTGERVQ